MKLRFVANGVCINTEVVVGVRIHHSAKCVQVDCTFGHYYRFKPEDFRKSPREAALTLDKTMELVLDALNRTYANE